MSEATFAHEHRGPYKVPPKTRLFRFIFRPIFRVIFHILCRVEITGRENIPTGAHIIAHNHISLFEPPLVLAFWHPAPEAIAGADVFDRPGQKILVRAYGAIPVHRGEYDRKVIENMLWVLASGKPLVIAPEGGRGHQPGLRQALAGVAYLMDRAGVPVVPVGITGTIDDMMSLALRGKRPLIQMHIGKPFILPTIEGRGEERRSARQANADLVMRHIAALLPPEYRGVYEPFQPE
jgi:1-acyl-sn-glycerol-3-phosphate acyltransferase